MRNLLQFSDSVSSEGLWQHASGTMSGNHTVAMRVLMEETFRMTPDSPLVADWQTIVSLFITILGSSLASSAGIGGGALFVPMFHVLVGFGLKTSTALSQAVITGGSLASVMLNAFKNNPDDPSKPLIDYRLVLVFTPVLLLGVNTGVLMNTMLPEWLITTLLVSLIIYIVATSCKKGRQLWKKEREYTLIAAAHPEHNPMHLPVTQEYKALPEAADQSPVQKRAVQDVEAVEQQSGNSVRGARTPAAGSSLGVPRGRSTPIKKSLESHTPQGTATVSRRPWRAPSWLHRSSFQTAELLLLWAGFSAIQVMKNRTKVCSHDFWYFYLGQVLLMLGASVVATWQGMTLQKRQLAHPGHMVVVMDGVRRVASQPNGAVQQFTWKMMVISQFVTLIAGIMGGLLGIGGGMVMGPLLLHMGVEPQVTASTTSLMVLFSSSTAVVQFSIMGRLNPPYAALFSGVSLLASLAGVLVVSSYVKRSGRTSVIVLILAFVVSVGGLVTGILGFRSAAQDFKMGTNIGFNPFCP